MSPTPSMSVPRPAPVRRDAGGVIILFMVLLVPLVVLVGAFVSAMTARTTRLSADLGNERALLAAESGIDEALFRARNAALASGVRITRTLAPDTSFDVLPTLLRTDGIDNDGDTEVDEADEDVFQLIAVGQYRDRARRLAAYLGQVSFLPALNGALTLMTSSTSLEVRGNSRIDGRNHAIDGTLVDGSDDGYGIAVGPAGNREVTDGQLTGTERSKVLGEGDPPSMGNAPAFDFDELVTQMQNAASLVLTNSHYADLQFGDGSAGTGRITFREGNVSFSGTTRGAGLLAVRGNLRVTGRFRFDGVILVTGSFDVGAGNSAIYGGLVLGPSSPSLELAGTADLRFSAEALALAKRVSTRYVAFNGWQELARQ